MYTKAQNLLKQLQRIAKRYKVEIRMQISDTYQIHVFAKEAAGWPIEGSDLEIAYEINKDFEECISSIIKKIECWDYKGRVTK